MRKKRNFLHNNGGDYFMEALILNGPKRKGKSRPLRPHYCEEKRNFPNIDSRIIGSNDTELAPKRKQKSQLFQPHIDTR